MNLLLLLHILTMLTHVYSLQELSFIVYLKGVELRVVLQNWNLKFYREYMK